MNASAYLKGHGWRGEGFSLDRSDRGIAKPLLVAHKRNANGLGAKANDVASQWWLHAFDKSLKTFGGDRESAVTITPALAKRTGLYAAFVKAETLESTIRLEDRKIESEESEESDGDDSENEGKVVAPVDSKNRIRAENVEGKGQRRKKDKAPSDSVRREKKHKRTESKAAESKTERRARKEQKRLLKASRKAEIIQDAIPSGTSAVAVESKKGRSRRMRKTRSALDGKPNDDSKISHAGEDLDFDSKKRKRFSTNSEANEIPDLLQVSETKKATALKKQLKMEKRIAEKLRRDKEKRREHD